MIIVVSYELNINYVERSMIITSVWVSQWSAKTPSLGALSPNGLKQSQHKRSTLETMTGRRIVIS